MALKQTLTKKPASKLTNGKAWASTPYLRNGHKAPRVDRLKWKRTLQALAGLTEKDAVELLMRDGLLPTWEGASCPFCTQGIVGPVQDRDSGLPRYRCRRRNCHKFITPQHLHPFFSATRGPEGRTLGLQAGLLLLLLAGAPSSSKLSSIHLVTQVNHKVVERLRKSLAFVRKAFVEHVQAGMVFGGRKNAWQDVEVDETSFDKKLVPMDEIEGPERNMKWEQWVGMVQRGKPTSLVLLRLSSKLTKKRSPGPGPIRKDEWRTIADKWLKDKQIILHTDSAKAYKQKVRGVHHGSVIHQKKRIKVRWCVDVAAADVRQAQENHPSYRTKADCQGWHADRRPLLEVHQEPFEVEPTCPDGLSIHAGMHQIRSVRLLAPWPGPLDVHG
ncbi:unnamed protein product [Symbiodinium sp. CCMP2592]|nr:unnamed protein product [Symbiodinium sp. CCMP2592]